MKKKTLFPFLSLLLGLLLAELFLRALGWGVLLMQESRNWSHSEGSSAIRILTVGESTTADQGSGVGIESWPRQLEALLKKNGANALVFNEGRSATTTAHILSRIEGQISRYHPDVVISMMGINDTRSIRLFPASEDKGLENLRIYRFGKFIYNLVKALFQPNAPSATFWGLPSTKKIIEELKTQSLETVWPEIQGQAHDFDKVKRAQYYAFLGDKAMPALMPVSKEFLNSFKLYDLSLQEYFEVQGTSEKYIYLTTKVLDFSHCKQVLKRYVDQIGPLNETFLMKAGNCLAAHPEDKELADLLSKNEENIRVEDGYQKPDNTRENYVNFHKVLLANKILHIAMQYPLNDLTDLQDFFSSEFPADRPFFVSNKDNFQRALETHSENEIFTDHFAGIFGHTTTLGHTLIAISACNGVLQVLKERGRKNLPETCSPE